MKQRGLTYGNSRTEFLAIFKLLGALHSPWNVLFEPKVYLEQTEKKKENEERPFH